MIHSAGAGVKAPLRTPIGFQFVAVPAYLLRAGDLSFGAVVLLGVVDDAARNNRSGLCKLANATLAARIGRSESEVGRYLIELESAGLIRREYGASRHVRLGVRTTWSEPVPDVPGTPPVQVPELREPGPRPSGIGVAGLPGPIQNPASEPEVQTLFLPPGAKAEDVPGPAEAAAFLRSMVAKGRQPQSGDSRFAPAPRMRTEADSTTVPVAPPSGLRLDSPRREVARMVDQLVRNFTEGRPRPRRLSPQQLARQLAEVRRRHGNRSASGGG